MPGGPLRARASRRSWFLASLVLLLAAATPATAGDILGDDAPLSLRDRLARHRRLAAEPELVLAPGGGDDGYLRAAEIYPLALHAQLVVLSACRSGAGRLAGGEGLLSLERALPLRRRAGGGGDDVGGGLPRQPRRARRGALAAPAAGALAEAGRGSAAPGRAALRGARAGPALALQALNAASNAFGAGGVQWCEWAISAEADGRARRRAARRRRAPSGRHRRWCGHRR